MSDAEAPKQEHEAILHKVENAAVPEQALSRQEVLAIAKKEQLRTKLTREAKTRNLDARIKLSMAVEAHRKAAGPHPEKEKMTEEEDKKLVAFSKDIQKVEKNFMDMDTGEKFKYVMNKADEWLTWFKDTVASLGSSAIMSAAGFLENTGMASPTITNWLKNFAGSEKAVIVEVLGEVKLKAQDSTLDKEMMNKIRTMYNKVIAAKVEQASKTAPVGKKAMMESYGFKDFMEAHIDKMNLSEQEVSLTELVTKLQPLVEADVTRIQKQPVSEKPVEAKNK